MNCRFCNLKKKEMERVFESGLYTTVLHSKYPICPGHLLIVPIRHVEFFDDLTEEEKNEIFSFISIYQRKILNTLSSGVDIQLHIRPFLKEGKYKVDHLHFHLIPRDFKDNIWQKSGRYLDSLYYKISSEDIAVVRERFKTS